MFVTNWISTTKIQKISEITNFFRHYFLSRTEVNLHFPFIPHIVTLTLVHPSDVLGLLLRNGFAVQLHQLLDTCLLASPDVNQVLALMGVPIVCPIKKKYFHLVTFKSSTLKKIILDFLIHCLFKLLFSEESELFL